MKENRPPQGDKKPRDPLDDLFASSKDDAAPPNQEPATLDALVDGLFASSADDKVQDRGSSAPPAEGVAPAEKSEKTQINSEERKMFLEFLAKVDVGTIIQDIEIEKVKEKLQELGISTNAKEQNPIGRIIREKINLEQKQSKDSASNEGETPAPSTEGPTSDEGVVSPEKDAKAWIEKASVGSIPRTDLESRDASRLEYPEETEKSGWLTRTWEKAKGLPEKVKGMGRGFWEFAKTEEGRGVLTKATYDTIGTVIGLKAMGDVGLLFAKKGDLYEYVKTRKERGEVREVVNALAEYARKKKAEVPSEARKKTHEARDAWFALEKEVKEKGENATEEERANLAVAKKEYENALQEV